MGGIKGGVGGVFFGPENQLVPGTNWGGVPKNSRNQLVPGTNWGGLQEISDKSSSTQVTRAMIFEKNKVQCICGEQALSWVWAKNVHKTPILTILARMDSWDSGL